jgi:phage terminase small subunit
MPRKRQCRSQRLTPKQARFVTEYMIDLNATQAAIRAGYSAKRADAQGYENLRKPEIAAAIARAQAARAERTGITAERVLQEIARLAFVDIRKAFLPDGSLKPITALDDDTAAALAGLQVDELWEWVDERRVQVGQTKKLKLWDKTANLTLLAKHLRLLVDRVEERHEVGEGLAALLKAMRGPTNQQPDPPTPDGGVPPAP